MFFYYTTVELQRLGGSGRQLITPHVEFINLTNSRVQYRFSERDGFRP